jgi:Rod binding domain-containing protein
MMQLNKLPAVSSGAATGAGAATGLDGKIQKSAKDFESLLLTSWLQAAEQSYGNVPGGEEDEDPGKEQFQSFSIQSLAAQITKSGGIGLASSIERQLRNATGHAPDQSGGS